MHDIVSAGVFIQAAASGQRIVVHTADVQHIEPGVAQCLGELAGLNEFAVVMGAAWQNVQYVLRAQDQHDIRLRIAVNGGEVQKEKIYDDNNFITWKKRWKERLKKSDKSSINYLSLMKKFNPIVIPRNNKVEEALRAAEENNIDPFNKLLKILKNPYVNQKEIKEYQIPSNTNENYQTFCGT